MKFPCVKMSLHYPKPYEPFRGEINVKVDLSNYGGKKADLKMQQESIHLKQLQNLIQLD